MFIESRVTFIWHITETIKTSGHWLLTVLVWSEAADWHQVNIRHPPSLSGWTWVSEGARDNHDTGAHGELYYNYYEPGSRGNWKQLKPGGFLFNFGVKIWILGKIFIFKTHILLCRTPATYYIGIGMANKYLLQMLQSQWGISDAVPSSQSSV